MNNWQKVQLNTDLFSDTQKYLYTKQVAWLKQNEIMSLIKNRWIKLGGAFFIYKQFGKPQTNNF